MIHIGGNDIIGGNDASRHRPYPGGPTTCAPI